MDAMSVEDPNWRTTILRNNMVRLQYGSWFARVFLISFEWNFVTSTEYYETNGEQITLTL